MEIIYVVIGVVFYFVWQSKINVYNYSPVLAIVQVWRKFAHAQIRSGRGLCVTKQRRITEPHTHGSAEVRCVRKDLSWRVGGASRERATRTRWARGRVDSRACVRGSRGIASSRTRPPPRDQPAIRPWNVSRAAMALFVQNSTRATNTTLAQVATALICFPCIP